MTNTPTRIRVEAASHTLTGPYREHNEDNFYCNCGEGIFVVADGMGGQQAGEQASRMVVEMLPSMLTSVREAAESFPPEERIGAAIFEVNQSIHEYGKSHPECHQMGTTVVAVLVIDDVLYVTGVGDSRVYHFRDNKVQQITTDHTVTEALLKRGLITEDQAKVHKYRHVLWRYLGSANMSEPPEVHRIELMPGDRFLLASDGLTGVIEDEELSRIVHEAGSVDEAVAQLAKRSQELDSHDNVTCIVLRVEEA